MNPFHEKEYTFAELDMLIDPFFSHRKIIFENHVDGFAVSGPSAELNTLTNSGESPPATLLTDRSAVPSLETRASDAYFFIAVCSARPLPPFSPLLFIPYTGNVLRERAEHIAQLEKQVAAAQAARDEARAEFTRMERELNKFREHFTRREAELEQMVVDRDAWAASLATDVAAARDAHEQLHSEFEERTVWAQRLERELQQSTAALNEALSNLHKIYRSLWYRIGEKFGMTPFRPDARAGRSGGQ